MPELPEVETVRRGLVPKLVGRRIVRLRADVDERHTEELVFHCRDVAVAGILQREIHPSVVQQRSGSDARAGGARNRRHRQTPAAK